LLQLSEAKQFLAGRLFQLIKEAKAMVIGRAVASESSIRLLEESFGEVAYCTTEEFEADRGPILKNQDLVWIHVETRMLESDLSLLKEGAVLATTTTGTTHIPNTVIDKLGNRFLSLKNQSVLLNQISSTAELAWCLVLSASTNAFSAAQDVLLGNWDRSAHVRKSQVRNQAIGVVGFGRLGRMVAAYAKSFGCSVLVWDISMDALQEAQKAGFEVAENLKTLCRDVDIVSLHVNTFQGAEPIITSEILASAQNLSIVNTSRGSVVDEDAIIQGLEKGLLSQYLADVMSFEESHVGLADSKLWKRAKQDSRIMITPHIGGASSDAMEMCEHNIISRAKDALFLS